MHGLDLKSIKKHPSLIPLFAVLLGGVATATLYLGRLGLKSPDVSWNKKLNPEPWNEYSKKRYKILYPSVAKNNTRMVRPHSLWD